MLGDTETPEVLSLPTPEQSNIVDPTRIWGRLVSTLVQLDSHDLVEKTFSLGRSEHNNVTIHKDCFLRNRLASVSNIHFLISREGHVTFIEDRSKNGTFVNRELVGRGNKIILQDNDEISISFKSLKVYVFKDLNNLYQAILPPVLKHKYQIERLLGQGACADVHLVMEKDTCKRYAIKRVFVSNDPNSKRHNLNNIQNIQTELTLLRNLNHPNIIKMKEIIETPLAVFIVLEYMRGGELNNVLHSTIPLVESEVKIIFYQIVQAVHYLHSMGITHRDLKAENVLLRDFSPRSLVKVSDFGLSKLIDNAESMYTMCGTPQYLAPEIINTQITSYTNKIDVWSLGVLLYYALSQQFPFSSESRELRNFQILKGEFSFDYHVFSNVSPACKDLIQNMLKIVPQYRYSIEEVLAHPWLNADPEMKSLVKDLIMDDAATELMYDSLRSTSSLPSTSSSERPSSPSHHRNPSHHSSHSHHSSPSHHSYPSNHSSPSHHNYPSNHSSPSHHNYPSNHSSPSRPSSEDREPNPKRPRLEQPYSTGGDGNDSDDIFDDGVDDANDGDDQPEDAAPGGGDGNNGEGSNDDGGNGEGSNGGGDEDDNNGDENNDEEGDEEDEDEEDEEEEIEEEPDTTENIECEEDEPADYIVLDIDEEDKGSGSDMDIEEIQESSGSHSISVISVGDDSNEGQERDLDLDLQNGEGEEQHGEDEWQDHERDVILNGHGGQEGHVVWADDNEDGQQERPDNEEGQEGGQGVADAGEERHDEANEENREGDGNREDIGGGGDIGNDHDNDDANDADWQPDAAELVNGQAEDGDPDTSSSIEVIPHEQDN